jgi:hypothetical protein
MRSSLFFQLPNRGPQPATHCLFNLLLIAVSIERVQCLSQRVEGNMLARELLRAALGWHQLYQNAIGTGVWGFFAVVVYARRGVFENKARSPGFPVGTSISALFEEIEFTP